MKFSVVITTYNRLPLLKRAIDSALNQTVAAEVVVADDASTDEEVATYVRSLGDRVIYHRNTSNLGHAATVNAGVQQATGDWIKFLDDDDYLAVNCVEEMIKAIQLRPQAVICSCVAAQVDSNEVEISRTKTFGPGTAFYIPQSDIHYGMLLEQLPFGTPAQVACRRDAFLQTGGWDSNLDANCDDIDSWIRIAQYGDAILLNQCLAYRTIWQGAYNHQFPLQKRLDTNILMKEKIYGLVNQNHRSQIPAFRDIKNYLKLHWTLVALKQRNIASMLKMLDSAILSIKAWRLLLQATLSQDSQQNNTSIRKLVLID